MTRRRAAWAAAMLVVVAAGCRPGTPETGFGDDGTVILEGPAGAVSAAPAPAGGVVVAHGDGEVTRLAADGTVVAGWGGPLPLPCAERDEIDRDDEGRYLLACTSTAADGTRVTDVVRLTPEGTPDPDFGTGGVARLPGTVEGPAVVPLPGGRVLALGGPPPALDVEPVLITTVLDRRGQVSSTKEEVLEQVPDVPPEFRAGAAVDVVAEPTHDGAVVAVHAATLLTMTDAFRPADPFLLRFDADGAEVGRMGGPIPPTGPSYSQVTALDELPGGRIVVLEEWLQLIDGPRPTTASGYRVHVFAPDGTTEHAFEPQTPPTPDAPATRLLAKTLLVTGGGRHLLVGGAHAGAGASGWRQGVERYDTSTWLLDPGFGTGGLADVGQLHVRDLDARVGSPGQVDVTGPHGPPVLPAEAPAAVVRLWNQPPAGP